MSIEVSSPTRVDISGGTLDMWPIYSFLGGATTINFGIDIFTTARLIPRKDREIGIFINDLKFEHTFESFNDFKMSDFKELGLLKEVLLTLAPRDKGFDLETSSQSPVGGGLGGSSSLTISIIEALLLWNGDASKGVLDRVHLAHNFEACLLGVPTGTQDYFAPATKGGLNIIDYNHSGIEFQTKSIPDCFSEKFVLVYSGKPHHSGMNNWKVLKDFVDGDRNTRQAIKGLKGVADEARTVVIEEKWEDLPIIFDEEFKYRNALAEAFSSPDIEKIRDITKDIGKSSIKICGAGGGGCVMIWTDAKEEVVEACRSQKYVVLDAKPVQRQPGLP